MHIPLSYTCTHILDMLFRDINITCQKKKYHHVHFHIFMFRLYKSTMQILIDTYIKDL